MPEKLDRIIEMATPFFCVWLIGSCLYAVTIAATGCIFTSVGLRELLRFGFLVGFVCVPVNLALVIWADWKKGKL